MNSPVACVQRSQIIYADSLKTHFSEGKLIAGKRSPLAYSLLPATIKRTTDATRISSLVLSPARHGAGRRRPRALGRAASWFSDQRGRRVGTRRPEHDRRARRLHRCGKNQVLQHKFDQWAKLLQQGSV